MMLNPRIGQAVQVWYRRDMRWMPYHGRVGVVRVRSRGKPRNHGVVVAERMVSIPCGNLRPAPGKEAR